MKRIALALAVFALLAGCHKRQQSEFVANDGGCGMFEESFTRKGYRTRHDARPQVKCTLIEKEGATCIVENLGIPRIADSLPFKGEFSWDEKVFIITGDHDVFKLRLLCKSPTDCYQLQVWNQTNLIGVGCDIRPTSLQRSKAPDLNTFRGPATDGKNTFNL